MSATIAAEILDALPQVGLQLWMLCDNGAEGWYCVLCERGSVPKWEVLDGRGRGATAAAALTEALAKFGVEISDE